jgi:translation initiation factor 2 subunit 2
MSAVVEAAAGAGAEPSEEDAALQAMLESLKKEKKKKPSKKKAEGEDGAEGAAEGASEGTGSSSRSKYSIQEAREGEYSFQHMLDRIYTELRAKNPDLVNKKRAVLRPPEVMRVGTSKILWANFPEICKMMKRDPDHVFRFFLAELGTTGSIDGNSRFLIKGKFVPKTIESLLKKYIAEYVSCSMCRQVDTKLVRDAVSRMYFMHCGSCGAAKSVASIQKGFHAVNKGDRRAARNANN